MKRKCFVFDEEWKNIKASRVTSTAVAQTQECCCVVVLYYYNIYMLQCFSLYSSIVNEVLQLVNRGQHYCADTVGCIIYIVTVHHVSSSLYYVPIYTGIGEQFSLLHQLDGLY